MTLNNNPEKQPASDRTIVLKNRRLFYIEDDVKNRLIVQMIVESAGARIDFERWGFIEIAIPKLRAFHPEIILLDLMFPMKHTGYDVFDAIRKVPELAYTPIVAVSASDPSIEIPKAKAHGFAGFIGKPLNLMRFPLQLAFILEGNQFWNDSDLE
ncbi:MAG: response regulator [Chloroflexota bacterium]|nr:response regulator [Chloroflexota bacterium]